MRLLVLLAPWFIPLADNPSVMVHHGASNDPSVELQSNPPKAQCKRGADGAVACGYDCKVGSNGKAACSPVSYGTCMSGANGEVVCFRPPFEGAKEPKSECVRGGDGGVACGYDCKVGGNGKAACSTVSFGTCMAGASGEVTCFTPPFLCANRPKSECVRGGDGGVACGYDCKVGSNGKALCSPVSYGTCTTGGNGQVVCFSTPPLTCASLPSTQCVRGSDGGAACGYDCKVGGNGKAVCSSRANGACQAEGNGSVACF